MKKILATIVFVLMAFPSMAKPIGNGTIKIHLEDNTLNFDNFTISFQRTLRLPVDGKQYPLPPGLGKFPIYQVQDYASKLPKKWVEEGGVFIPMYQREAMWISFGGEEWRPRAVKIGIGKINVLTGETWDAALKETKDQDYLVAPNPQPWIDGIKAGKDFIRQFVAMPLGQGLTVEGQITGKEEVGGLQIAVYNPKKNKFKKPSEDKNYRRYIGGGMMGMMAPPSSGSQTEMGLGAGGKMRQKVYPDPHGFATWDLNKFAALHVHIVNSQQFEKITGQKPPESPITKKEYELRGYPWFGLYDEQFVDIKAQEKLKRIKPVRSDEEPSIKVKKKIIYKMPKS